MKACFLWKNFVVLCTGGVQLWDSDPVSVD